MHQYVVVVPNLCVFIVIFGVKKNMIVSLRLLSLSLSVVVMCCLPGDPLLISNSRHVDEPAFFKISHLFLLRRWLQSDTPPTIVICTSYLHIIGMHSVL